MASVIVSPERDTDRRASKDLPHLSLSLESPASTSPFPSPSSSFLPPPMPGAHEFANKLPLPGSKASKKSRDSTDSSTPPTSAASPAPTGVNGHGRPTSSTTGKSPAPAMAPPLSPAAPKQAELSPPTTPKSKRSSMPLLSSTHTQDLGSELPITPRHAKHTSLSSTRPAPPSPSISRRASGAQSTQSGYTSVSRPLSRAPSTSTKRSSQMMAMSQQSQSQKRRSLSVKIRDFAFALADPRHTGQGPDAPRFGRNRASTASSDCDGASSRRNSGWGAFRWAGSKLWGFGFGGGAGSRGSRSQVDDGGFAPTKSDFERNFDISSPADDYPEEDYEDNGEGYQDSQDDEGDDGYVDQDVPLLPGLYRALYSFDPEGTAEMALAEDQVVRIIGRGGGVGWAIAVDDSGGHALVPESYLEVVKLDETDVS